MRRSGGGGVAIVWFRNDLRVLDNEAVVRAWAASDAVLPVYCVDPRISAGSTHYFGFPKTGGERIGRQSLTEIQFASCRLLLCFGVILAACSLGS
jgi:hypothetical protein